MAAEPRGLELRGTKGGNTSQSTRPQERAGSVPPRQRGIRRVLGRVVMTERVESSSPTWHTTCTWAVLL
eukprot:6519732-Pyramimonas_sp.AAC.1